MTRERVNFLLGVWQARLGLLHWNLRINWDLQPEADEEGKAAEASISVHPDYDQATVRINADTYPAWSEEMAAVTIVHELLHVYERGVRNANVDVGKVLPSKVYELHWARYEHEVENWIDRLAAIIVGMDDPGVDKRTLSTYD